eukprot:36504-Eustigmatos_ZCMA.PRE.1
MRGAWDGCRPPYAPWASSGRGPWPRHVRGPWPRHVPVTHHVTSHGSPRQVRAYEQLSMNPVVGYVRVCVANAAGVMFLTPLVYLTHYRPLDRN